MSENLSDPVIPRIADRSDSSKSKSPALSDLSPGDKPWDKHKAYSDRVQNLYANSEFHDYSERINFCAQFLEFGFAWANDDALKLKLRGARFCRVRHCPVCQFRRSLMWRAKAFKLIPKIEDAYPKTRWIFATFTVKNVPVIELRETLREMNLGFRRMTQRKTWPALGWVRTMEVTKANDGKAHPHFHTLILTRNSYFKKRYLSQAAWTQIWRECMKLDYDPVLNIQAVKGGKGGLSLVPELFKYCTKESDLVANREWLFELTRQLHKMRAIATGGVVKDFLRELEDEPVDLIGKDEEADQIDEFGSIYFWWKQIEKKYRMANG